MRVPLPLARLLIFTVTRPLGPPTPVPLQRAWLQLVSTGGILPRGTTVERMDVGGRPAERLVPPGADRSRSVLLLHGGAFLVGSPRTHRVLAGHLAAAAGVPVVSLHYRRAPEHPWPAAVDDAHAAYRELAAAGPTAVFGDSAGGGLALLLALRLREEGAEPPAGLALVSPVADLTLDSSEAFRRLDLVVRRRWLGHGVRGFVGGGDAAALSPLNADLAGLPPVLVQVAGKERLRVEGVHLAARLREAGVPVELDVLPRLWHDAHLLAHLVPEATGAVRRIGDWLAERLAAARRAA